ncbi:hypothetical protein EHV15_09070 [Paenibacillus oralis]|uniref:Uncharacterized protein n=1 Tax=Paenibacillus oralis TaxID=2490856 RepID=A0A3P3TY74_9BACL|nr:hypothetical protein [Paenibacillus oralis]RRJ63061.1 hypothetical protein EHV15_09070 [Paenibacillus oralis]
MGVRGEKMGNRRTPPLPKIAVIWGVIPGPSLSPRKIAELFGAIWRSILEMTPLYPHVAKITPKNSPISAELPF